MQDEKRIITGGQAINEALDISLGMNSDVFVFGLGASDPKGIFGTTSGLAKKYGHDRCMDVPLSENALTGIAVGAATLGMRPVLTHQRLDFALLSLDQIINNAAKWHYMFAGKYQAPITIRMIIGRGWGQGPQHSQSLQALFAHIPGLKVVMPSLPSDSKGLLLASIEDNSPVVFIEHRWLHACKGHVPDDVYRTPLSKAKILKEGKDITLVGISYMVLEMLQAAEHLEKIGISAEVIDLRTLSPYDKETVLSSVKKTGRALVADTGYESFGSASEIIATISRECFTDLKTAPMMVASPDLPVPTTPALSEYFYRNSIDIVSQVAESLNIKNHDKVNKIKEEIKNLKSNLPHDVPDGSFSGPF